jgi:hypothetical protein
MKPINRRWPRVRRYVLSGYPWRRFNPLRISDWRKRAEYRRWLKKWGLK